MKRIQLFEIEDFSWFPSTIRTSMTNLIIVFLKMMKTSEVISLQLKRIQKMYPFKRIVDMGSGSGGVMPIVHQELSKESDIELLLTDLHPNRRLAIKINRARTKNLHYQSTPLDATDLSHTPEGLKTMINSFHHMPPNKAKEILKSAQENRQPLFVYELAENKIPVLVWALFLPVALPLMMVMTLFMTPFVRPMTWQQLVFTYIIPIIPLAYAWDGQASYPRTYTFSDLEEMISEIQNDQYDWEVAPALNAKGKKSGYYILGLPK